MTESQSTPALPGRASTQCFCCWSTDLEREWAATSPFFAQRALRRQPQAITLIKCLDCGTRYFDFSPTTDELDRLYAGYRGTKYFIQRNSFEPWYTRAVNDDLGAEAQMQTRRAVLRDALEECGAAEHFENILDHGGDKGQMLHDLRAKTKAVYDISGVPPEEGVIALDQAKIKETPWDLILSCHVLEHLPDPQSYLEELVALGRAGTIYFFEVPDESFRSFGLSASSLQKRWIGWLTKRIFAFKVFDFLSTACRVKLRVLPPLCFVALREHLSFFSTQGLSRLLQDNQLTLLSVKIRASGHICAVAMKTTAN